MADIQPAVLTIRLHTKWGDGTEQDYRLIEVTSDNIVDVYLQLSAACDALADHFRLDMERAIQDTMLHDVFGPPPGEFRA